MATPLQQENTAGNEAAPSRMSGLELMAQLNGPAMEIMRELNTRAMTQMAEAHSTWMRFMQRRVTSDMELPAKLAQCHSLQEWMHVYSDFFQAAIRDYQEELAEVTRIGQAFSNEAAEVVRDKASETERRLSVH